MCSLPALILVNGSDSLRIGSGADMSYRHMLPNVYGVPKAQSAPLAAGKLKPIGKGKVTPALKAEYVCGEVAPNAAALDTIQPIRNGLIEHWVCQRACCLPSHV